MWFEELTGFVEQSPDQVRSSLIVDNETLTSQVNGKSYQCGKLTIPTLSALRKQASTLDIPVGKLTINEVVGDVKALHADPSNEHALFQAASQFNLLEMVNPQTTPEEGVGIYQYDRTQGPACAIACGAGTIYRNYFATVNEHVGQSEAHQIDCLDEIGKHLGNDNEDLWEMKNGYALANRTGLERINAAFEKYTATERNELKAKLKIGLQWHTQVTLNGASHLVTQAYCSALPVAYSGIDSVLWEPFARLVLEGTYEATFYAALINLAQNGSNKVYLTLVGGGAFGNEMNWIMDALQKSLKQFKDIPLDIKIVSYGHSNTSVQSLIHNF